MADACTQTLSLCLERLENDGCVCPSVLSVCSSAALAAHVERCLRASFNLVTVRGDITSLTLPREPVGVIVLEADPESAAVDHARQLLAGQSPETTLLVVGEACGPRARITNRSGRPTVRYLSHPFEPGLLEQMVEDHIESYRLRRSERTLMLELDHLQQQVDELGRQASEEGVQSTASLLRLYHVVSGLSGLTTLQEIGELVVSTAASMLHSRRVSLLVPDANREYLIVAAAVGIPYEAMERVRIPIGQPVTGQVFATARSILVQNGLSPPGWRERVDPELIPDPPFISMALTGPDSVVAVLNISDPVKPDAYTEASLTGLHAITEAATIALANQIRGQERNEARDGIMMAMAKLAESRDPETGKHLERVQNYCRALAEELAGLPKYNDVITPEFINTLVWSSPLHDIGKVGVPDDILLKPGRLTPEEFEIMKRHSVIGGDTIKALIERGRRRDFLQMAMEIAYHHHEKFDGSGYPFQLAGEAIPLAARIVALADVYDALTSVRVYKQAMPHDEAYSLIMNGKGLHFDPDVVDAFARRAEDFAKLAQDLADE